MTTGKLKTDRLGACTQLVEVVATTPKRVRIRALSLTTLWGKRHNRFLAYGETALVRPDRLLADSAGGEPVLNVNRLTGRPC